MYIAKSVPGGQPRYTLRQTCRQQDGTLFFKNLADLGHDPSKFIEYPGGNAFHMAETLVDHLEELNVDVDMDLLETLFMPFLDPEIRLAVEVFLNRSRQTIRLTLEEEGALDRSLLDFDKRRLHYLKFGTRDQGPVAAMPTKIMGGLSGKCRDEIEQYFIRHEEILDHNELKSYLFISFDLQRFFGGILAKKMPQALDQDRVDRYFLDEICTLNERMFGNDSEPPGSTLHPYLVRYLIFFYDQEYLDSTLLDDFARQFMERHRSFRPPAAPRREFNLDKACAIFKIQRNEITGLTRRDLTRRYRRLARTCHPDRGGTQDAFVALNNAFQRLIDALN
ncbi:MAG: J domain-containing protein [Desulfobacterium sp.]|nr:J domain-containing protein [Desulfobacterium sp.]